MPLHKCLGCRGLANAGLLQKDQKWEWKVVTIKNVAAYHLVRLKHAVNKVVGGGVLWRAETACGEDIVEEVHDED